VIEKQREIFLYENVRIHLDTVESLGTFLEFEAVIGPDDDVMSGKAKVDFLCKKFGIADDDLLPNSYVDLANG
jgi:predicted adenylyl cyclase CyaB